MGINLLKGHPLFGFNAKYGTDRLGLGLRLFQSTAQSKLQKNARRNGSRPPSPPTAMESDFLSFSIS